MADTYGVTAASVAAEVPSLFAGGFSNATTPTDAVVASWIAAADVVVTLHVQRAAAQVPAATDQAVPLAQRYIIVRTLASVMRTVYAGHDPERVAAAAKPYDDDAMALLKEIDALGEQMTGTGQTTNRVKGDDLSLARDLLLDDSDLGGLQNANLARTRRF